MLQIIYKDKAKDSLWEQTVEEQINKLECIQKSFQTGGVA
jgi:hypothetical protein